MTESELNIKRIVEGAIIAAGDALTVDRLLSLFDESERPEKNEIIAALEELKIEFKDRGFALVEVASGWRFQVEPDLARWVNKLWEEKPQKYSRALLETMALIAYRQPLTRGDIEEVRGVAVSSHIIKTLAEREWIKVVGHRDVPGRPSLYATTKQFLDYFGLKSLDELPSLGELKDLDSLNAKLELDLDENSIEQEQIAEAKDDGERRAQEEGIVAADNVDQQPSESTEDAVDSPELTLDDEREHATPTGESAEVGRGDSGDEEAGEEPQGSASEVALTEELEEIGGEDEAPLEESTENSPEDLLSQVAEMELNDSETEQLSDAEGKDVP